MTDLIALLRWILSPRSSRLGAMLQSEVKEAAINNQPRKDEG